MTRFSHVLAALLLLVALILIACVPTPGRGGGGNGGINANDDSAADAADAAPAPEVDNPNGLVNAVFETEIVHGRFVQPPGIGALLQGFFEDVVILCDLTSD